MFSRYLLTFLAVLYLVNPVFAMQKREIETYTNTGNNGSITTTIEPLGKKPNIFDKELFKDLISKKQLTAFIGEDIKDIKNYSNFQNKALEALLDTKIVKVKIQSGEKSKIFTSIDLRSFGNFLYQHDPAVQVLKRAVLANHDYIRNKQTDPAETFRAEKIPVFKPSTLYIASIREKLKYALYNKNPNIQAVNQLLVSEEYAFSNSQNREAEIFESIMAALLYLPMVKLTGNQNPVIDLSHLRKVILTSDQAISKLIQIQKLQEVIIANSDSATSPNMTKYCSLIEPFIAQEDNNVAMPSLDQTNQIPPSENLPSSKADYFSGHISLDETHNQIRDKASKQNEMQSEKLPLLSLDEICQSPAIHNLPTYMLENFASKDSVDQTDYTISLDQTTQTPAVINLPIYGEKHFSNSDSLDQTETIAPTETRKPYFSDMLSYIHKVRGYTKIPPILKS